MGVSGNASSVSPSPPLRRYLAELQSTLQTIVVEAEAILNDRPLTYVSSDIKEAEALNLSHLLYGRQIISVPHPLVESDEVRGPTYRSNTDFLREAKRVALLIQRFGNVGIMSTSLPFESFTKDQESTPNP